MKLIPLTQGKFAMVDDNDFNELNKYKWFLTKCRNHFYAARVPSRKLGKRKHIRMHVHIMKTFGTKKMVDHIDHNGLNNQRSNLRICTSAQNNSNKTSLKNSVSRFLGVSIYKRIDKNGKEYKKWTAKVHTNRERVYLAYFNTEIEAAIAYNKKAIEIHGEFANLNIIS